MNPDGSANVFPASLVMAVPRIAGVPSIEVGAHTDPGRDPNKQVNEDAMLARDTPHGFLAVVCDGMGGHVGGREASHLAIDTIFRVFDATPSGVTPQQLLRDALTQANGAVYARGMQSPELKGMGSTCVAILVHPGGTDVAHVGDSRVYLLTQGQVYQVTKDHSLVQRLVDANMLTPEQAANHPNANQITNAFGQRPDIEVEVRPHPFPHGAGDTFVLCSDGLSDEVGPQDILQVLAPLPPCEAAARQLVDLANARGGHDNITVVLVRFPGGAPFAVASPSGAATPTATLAAAPVNTTTAEMEILQPGAVEGAMAAPAMAPPGMAAPAMVPPPSAPPMAPPSAVAPASAVAPSSPSAPQFTPPPPYGGTPLSLPQKKSPVGIIVAVIVVLLLLSAGVAATLLMRGEPKNDAPKASTTADDDDVPEPAPTKSAAPKPIPKPTEDPSITPPEPSVSGPRPKQTGSNPPPPPKPKPPCDPDKEKCP
ncbi:MAG: serine/threonine-protein phosphatase [Deltaproteobacteria bacterium]|nr:serine/threonine-protein phosphatase [Deltaproteobacteria bacterium]